VWEYVPIGSDRRLLWTWPWTRRFPRKRWISWLSLWLLVSEGLRLQLVRCNTWLPQRGGDQTFRERNVAVIPLSWWGKVFLIFRCDIILRSLIACVATIGLLALAAEHLACAQLCAETHSNETLLLATYNKKSKNLPLKLLRYAFEAECTECSHTCCGLDVAVPE